MRVSIAYAEPESQFWQDLELNDVATVADAVERSGVLQRFPEIDLSLHKVGIFGKLVPLDTVVAEGDRIEIYRPIVCDPKTVKRRPSEDSDDD